MGINVSIKFFPHNRELDNGQFRIMGRIIVNRKKAEFATDLTCRPGEWDNHNGTFFKDTYAKEELIKIKSRIYSLKTFLELEDKEITARKLKILLQEKEKLRYGLLEYFDKFIEYHRDVGDLSGSSLGKYEATMAHLQEFLEDQRVLNTTLGEVDYALLSKWDGYLNTTKSKQFGRKLSLTTVHKHHVRLKTILLKAFNEGIIKKNPYAQFRLKTPPRIPKYLTKDELTRIEENDLGNNQSLLKVRDIFLFSCYTGLRYQDAQDLKVEDLQYDNGKTFIEISQKKTGEDVYIPFLEPADQIIKRWAKTEERMIKGALLPQISNVKVNAYLKVIQDLTGIRTRLTHNVARHTFATTILLDSGVPLEVTSKLLGHSNINTTQVYGKVTKHSINNHISRLNHKQ